MKIEQAMDKSGIYIDLIKQNNVIYPEESLFQKPLYNKLNALLDAQWSFLQNISEDQKKKISRCRVHNAILVYGKRGSGKTVFITEIADRLKSKKEWIIINLNPKRDLLISLAAKLESDTSLRKIFKEAEINLQAFGIGIGIKSS